MENKLYKVKQHNDLLESSYKAGINELRVLNLVLSKVDAKKAHLRKPYVISVEEFKNTFNIHSSVVHKVLKSACDKLLTTPIKIYTTNSSGKTVVTKFTMFSRLKYEIVDTAQVEVVFSDDVRPYLFELKKNFTIMNFQSLSKLDTEYSSRIYGWLCKAKNLRKNNSPLGVEGKFLDIEINEFKQRLGLMGKHEDFRNLRKHIIEPAVNKINANTELSVIFEPRKVGRSVGVLRFFFVIESEAIGEPVRGRLPRRPHVVSGSHAEGEWARKCISILSNHKQELERYGSLLPLKDMRKLIEYCKIVGDLIRADKIQSEVNLRVKS